MNLNRNNPVPPDSPAETPSIHHSCHNMLLHAILLLGRFRRAGWIFAGFNLTCSLFFMTATNLSADSVWEKTTWRGESAWSSAQGAVRAVVTEVRCRLIYLGSVDGTVNLINAPYPQTLPDGKGHWPNQGGHRFWLGPQSHWKWPPLAEWEYSAAAGVTTDGPVLILQERHDDPAYPAITREYAWEGARLRCTARWTDNGRAYFGLHVVPVDAPLVVTVRLEKKPGVPAGAVLAQMVNPEPLLTLPHPSVTVEGDSATVRSGIKVAKLGFVPQALTITRPSGWKLSVLPGPHEGVALDLPDQGYLSQIWVGGPSEHELAELEQLSPYLRGDAKGRCASSIFIEVTPPGS